MSATIVEFSAALTAPDAVRLSNDYGLKLDRYFGERSYLEWLPATVLDRVRGDFLVSRCAALTSAARLSLSIESLQPSPQPIPFSAAAFDRAVPAPLESALEAAGAAEVTVSDDREAGGTLRLNFLLEDLSNLNQVSQIDELVWIEPVFPINDTDNVEAAETMQSGFVGGGAASSPLWDKGLYGENEIVGVIDGDILDIAHCFFADVAPNKPGPAHRKVLSISNETGSGVGQHATRVCSVLAGNNPASSGASPARGGAWNAKLVFTNYKDLLPPTSRSIFSILTRAAAKGATIHSCSFDTTSESLYNNMARDVDQFSWKNENHLVIAAGANTGGTNSPPGNAKNTLCVAATKPFPEDMRRGSGVDGPTADGRMKPDLVAVGGNLEVAKVNTPCATEPYVGPATSYATPHTSAAAALVREYFRKGFYPDGEPKAVYKFEPTGSLIKAVLLNSTVDMTDEPGYPSNSEGWGLIRLNRSLYFKGGRRRLAVRDVRRAVGLDVGTSLTATDTERTHKIRVNDRNEQLKITLVWMDPPAAEGMYRFPSVNSLKLEAGADDGLTTYLGNDIDRSTGVSRPEADGGLDSLNNVQMIIVNNPEVGIWTIRVSTKSVWTGDEPRRQGYALAISGGIDVAGFLVGPIT